MGIRKAVAVAAVLLVGPVASAGVHGQHPGVVGGEGVMSPTVLVTYWAQTGEPSHILLLVLWRGRPGWLAGPFIGTTAPFDDTRADLRAARRHLLEAGYSVGTANLTVSFDPRARTVAVANESRALGDHNVVLVDSADTRPHVVRTFRLDPALLPERDFKPPDFSPIARIPDLHKILQRSKELLDFLR